MVIYLVYSKDDDIFPTMEGAFSNLRLAKSFVEDFKNNEDYDFRIVSQKINPKKLNTFSREWKRRGKNTYPGWIGKNKGVWE